VIQGSGNRVGGDLSGEELAALQQQMAERLQGRFGNIFSSLPGNLNTVQIPQQPTQQSTQHQAQEPQSQQTIQQHQTEQQTQKD